MWCDLHVHSDHSDGAFAPAAVIDMVADAGVEVVALTDHDTTGGTAEAAARASQRGVAFIHGLEMTTYTGGRVVHVLGLGVRPRDGGLARANENALAVWEANQRRWVRALEHEGFGVSEDSVLPDAPLRLPVLIERLCTRRVDQGDPKRCYERFKRFFAALPQSAYAQLPSPSAAADVIRSAGGVAVLAHPARLEDPGLAERIAREMDAIEALYAPYTSDERGTLIALSGRLGKPYSCGSDFHGHFDMRYENPRFEASRALLERVGVAMGRP